MIETVQELINELNKIEDKSKPVRIFCYLECDVASILKVGIGSVESDNDTILIHEAE